MRPRGLNALLASVFLALAGPLNGAIRVTFDDVESFTDFTIHGLFRQEDARALFEQQIQLFWKRRMQDLVPPDTSVELHFLDIDMAGDMIPSPRGIQSHTRVVEDRYPPRLEFEFRILSADGEALLEGREILLGKDFGFRSRRNPRSSDITFFFEFEMLREWLRKLELTAPASPSGKGA